MILITLIKKEVLHFFRNKSNVATMFIFPIVLIVILGFALNGLMNVDFNIFKDNKVYFKANNINTENKYLQLFNTFKNNCEEDMKIEFKEISEDIYGKDAVNNYMPSVLCYQIADKGGHGVSILGYTTSTIGKQEFDYLLAADGWFDDAPRYVMYYPHLFESTTGLSYLIQK